VIYVAKDIGSSNIKSDESHPSISKNIANTPDIENLVFHDRHIISKWEQVRDMTLIRL
jgi:hypothetical protein